MDGTPRDNDISKIVEADRAHIWHHLIQHKPFETNEPRIIVEGKDMRVWDQNGKEHIDGVSGGVWTVNVGYGRERIANAVRDQLLKLNWNKLIPVSFLVLLITCLIKFYLETFWRPPPPFLLISN